MKTAIFYFSGTGNTELIARCFKQVLQGRGCMTDLFRMEDVLRGKSTVNYGDYGLIGLGHPVYGFGASRLAGEFAEQLPEVKGTRAFVFKTASSPHYINYCASNGLLKSLNEKGYMAFHNSLLAMPCNFYVKYDERLNKQLYLTALKKVEIYAEEIVCGIPRHLKGNAVLEKILRKVAHWEEKQAGKAFGKGLQASAACTKCLKCVRSCPAGNISCDEEKGITFGTDCLLCMRCIYSCPQQAIFPTKLRGSVVTPYTGGIQLPGLLADPENDGCFVTEHSKGYYRHFISYIQEHEAINNSEKEERMR